MSIPPAPEEATADVPTASGRAAGRPPPRAGTRNRRLLAVAAALLWISGSVVIQLSRQPGPPATDTIWAEDGHLFLTAALNFDQPLELLFAPAGKYMHAAPRIVAMIVSARPLPEAAWLFATLSAVIVAALSVFVFVASKPLLPSPGARALLAAMMVLLAPANVESLNNAANLHYFLGFAAFWGLLAQPTSWPGSVVASLVVAVAALSDPVTLVLAPLAALPLVRRWHAKRLLVAGAFLIALAAHGVVWLTADGPGRYADPSVPAAVQQQLQRRSFAPQSYGDSSLGDFAPLYGLRVVGSIWGGNDLLERAWSSWGAAAAYLGLIGVLALAVIGARRRGLKARWRVAIFLVYSVLFFVVPVGIRGTEHLRSPPGVLSLAGSRYVLIPALLLLVGIAVCVEASRNERPWARALRVALGAAVLTVALTDLRDPNLRSLGPVWSAELAESVERCPRTTSYVEVPITPPEGFNVLASCSRIRSDVDSERGSTTSTSAGRRALKIISERATYRQSRTSSPSPSSSARSSV